MGKAEPAVNRTALVTGASAGLGRAFAEELARRSVHLVLVSLPGEGLSSLADALASKYSIRVDFIELDLTTEGAVQELLGFISRQKIRINILINNAGIGSTALFESLDIEFYRRQIFLNTIVPVWLTHALLPALKRQAPSYILNVSSLGSYFLLPGKEVYGASKSFLLSFSRSLRISLKSSGVQVSVVCPGPIDTNERLRRVHRGLKGLARKTVMQPEEVAVYSLDRLFKGKELILPGRLNRILLMLNSIMPGALVLSLTRKEMKRQTAQKGGNSIHRKI